MNGQMKLWCLPCLLGQGHTFHDDQSPNLAYNLGEGEQLVVRLSRNGGTLEFEKQ